MAATKAPRPPAKKTMEVDISWLEELPESSEPPTVKRPPRLPGAKHTQPPMPLPPSIPPGPRPKFNETIEVEESWLDIVDDAPAEKKPESVKPPKARSVPPKTSTRPPEPAKKPEATKKPFEPPKRLPDPGAKKPVLPPRPITKK